MSSTEKLLLILMIGFILSIVFFSLAKQEEQNTKIRIYTTCLHDSGPNADINNCYKLANETN